MTTEESSPLRPLGVAPDRKKSRLPVRFVCQQSKGALQGDFNEILKAAIDGGESLESAMRKAASLAAKEAIESLLRTEIKAILGYDRYDPSGKNSGDSRNGTYQRTVQTSLGPISVEAPRDRNGE